MKIQNPISNLFPKFSATTPGCAIGVVQDGKLVFKWNVGLAGVEKKRPITSLTQFRLASLTKPFTAMAIMLLKEKEELRFEDTLDMFFPNFPHYGKKITIRQLLTHTSGMPDHEQPLYKTLKKDEEPTLFDALRVLLCEQETLITPGSNYLYSDAGYVVLAIIIEKVTGRNYRDFLAENIFVPLKMENTLVVDETKPDIKNRAYGYQKKANTFIAYDYDPLNYIVGDEGIYSTVEDLAKWWPAWTTEILVNKNTLKQALQRQKLANGSLGRCGFSWFVDEQFVFHDGFWVGFNNIILTNLETNTTVILLSNTTEFPTEEKRITIALRILNNIRIN